MSNNYNNEFSPADTETSSEANDQKNEQTAPPHVIRRNIEDYLAERALKKRLTDIYDDDYLLDYE